MMDLEAVTDATALLDRLSVDPYPFYAQLRETGPICWVPELEMYLVTRYADVRAILRDADRFTTESPQSLIRRTFGEHMLTCDGPKHSRYRKAFQRDFMPDWIRDHMEAQIRDCARRLIGVFEADGTAELREAFASRLPIQVMLIAFGLPLENEQEFRSWYDHFEAALANHRGIDSIQLAADDAVRQMSEHFLAYMSRPTEGSLLDTALLPARPLSSEELVRNLSIIFFGGISTVEALILDALWVLLTEPGLRDGVAAEPALIDDLLEETMRWASPVQSATRFVRADMDYKGVHLRAGEVVNCMIGAANRDPTEFPDPDRFDIHRKNAIGHLGFAVGPHVCIGRRLARAEGHIAIAELLTHLPYIRLIPERSEPPTGHEFRQPRRLTVAF